MLEEKIAEAIVEELLRQAAAHPEALSVESSGELRVDGKIDVQALAMAIAGSVAGGP
jgi:hypothetical protein